MQLELEDPYVVVYKQIHAVVDDDAKRVELLERSSCYGGSAWARYHYSRGPLVISSCNQGEWFRYMLNPGNVDLDLVSSKRSAGIESVKVSGSEVEVTYAGLGGGGVGATLSRARAEDVLRYDATECGGGRVARGAIVLPRRERMIIGVDDTDSKTVGATWSLIHNIAQKVDRPEARYISPWCSYFPCPPRPRTASPRWWSSPACREEERACWVISGHCCRNTPYPSRRGWQCSGISIPQSCWLSV